MGAHVVIGQNEFSQIEFDALRHANIEFAPAAEIRQTEPFRKSSIGDGNADPQRFEGRIDDHGLRQARHKRRRPERQDRSYRLRRSGRRPALLGMD
ncbi:hypothetical protein SSBR45G_61790 [Bradyrhizobium sp. SSBR45G]|nr:hypothetical protein SSBR45G_61790 [Bradyrhizobium sp. SSBR45G]GLH88710.1 hypothetical protein SSBR45R_61710 [Bradyrhizobium sp. SSBR45R]